MGTLLHAAGLSFALVLAPFAETPALAEETQQAANEAHMNASAEVVQSMVDSYRKGDFEGWLRHYSTDATIIINNVVLIGRAELRKVFNQVRSDAEAVGIQLRQPEIVESGWTGDRIYLWTHEFTGENVSMVYTEYEVRNGQIVTVSARY